MPKSITTLIFHSPCWGDPPIFYTDQDAIEWAIGQGAFTDGVAAGLALAELRTKYDNGVWALWLGVVSRRLAGRNNRQQTNDVAWNRKTL